MFLSAQSRIARSPVARYAQYMPQMVYLRLQMFQQYWQAQPLYIFFTRSSLSPSGPRTNSRSR